MRFHDNIFGRTSNAKWKASVGRIVDCLKIHTCLPALANNPLVSKVGDLSLKPPVGQIGDNAANVSPPLQNFFQKRLLPCQIANDAKKGLQPRYTVGRNAAKIIKGFFGIYRKGCRCKLHFSVAGRL